MITQWLNEAVLEAEKLSRYNKLELSIDAITNGFAIRIYLSEETFVDFLSYKDVDAAKTNPFLKRMNIMKGIAIEELSS